jgi:hypothetical protein
MKKSCFLLLLAFAGGRQAFAQSAVSPSPAFISTNTQSQKVKVNGDGTAGYTLGLKMKQTIVKIDTSIKVSAKTAYLSLEMQGITGSSFAEVTGGTTSFWVTDKAGKPVKIAEKFLKRIGGAMEDNIVDFTAKIPFRLKTDKNNYTIRFRWQSADKRKIIDFVTTTK